MNRKDIHLVLIHGFLFNRTSWEKSAEILSQTYNVHIVDLPGYGKNATTEATTLAEMAQDILRQVGDAKHIVWMGWSLGGILAYYLAHQFPDITRGVITLASNPKFIHSDDWPCGINYGAFSTLKQTFIRTPKVALKRFIMLQSQHVDLAHSKNISQLQAYIESLPIEIILRDLNVLECTDLRKEYSELKIPLLNILAKDDKLVSISLADELKNLCGDSKNVIMENAGHAMLISHMDECLTHISKFINESIITQ